VQGDTSDWCGWGRGFGVKDRYQGDLYRESNLSFKENSYSSSISEADGGEKGGWRVWFYSGWDRVLSAIIVGIRHDHDRRSAAMLVLVGDRKYLEINNDSIKDQIVIGGGNEWSNPQKASAALDYKVKTNPVSDRWRNDVVHSCAMLVFLTDGDRVSRDKEAAECLYRSLRNLVPCSDPELKTRPKLEYSKWKNMPRILTSERWLWKVNQTKRNSFLQQGIAITQWTPWKVIPTSLSRESALYDIQIRWNR